MFKKKVVCKQKRDPERTRLMVDCRIKFEGNDILTIAEHVYVSRTHSVLMFELSKLNIYIVAKLLHRLSIKCLKY